MFYGDLNGKKIPKRGDICVCTHTHTHTYTHTHIADSLYYTVETNTVFRAEIVQQKLILK